LTVNIDEQKKEEFRKRLLAWFKKNGRKDIPWRKTRDAWPTLLASVLLRKTARGQVEKVYRSFAARFPNPEALARSSPIEVEHALQPLGMEHRRAEGLVNLGKQLVDSFKGSVPSTARELEDLPMVGPYTAREVLCIAFGQDEPMLDRNMIRIIQRVFSFKSTKRRPHTDPELWAQAKELIPEGRGREFNYAIMDFAHDVCKARQPLCRACLMRDICDYGRTVA
jgi:A/G-specific adenine glycosylase